MAKCAEKGKYSFEEMVEGLNGLVEKRGSDFSNKEMFYKSKSWSYFRLWGRRLVSLKEDLFPTRGDISIQLLFVYMWLNGNTCEKVKT